MKSCYSKFTESTSSHLMFGCIFYASGNMLHELWQFIHFVHVLGSILSQVKCLLWYILKGRDLSRQIPLSGKPRIPHTQHEQLHANWGAHTRHVELHAYTGTHTPQIAVFLFPLWKMLFQFLYSKHNFPYLIHLLPKGHTLKIMNINRDLCRIFSLVNGKLLWALVIPPSHFL